MTIANENEATLDDLVQLEPKLRRFVMKICDTSVDVDDVVVPIARPQKNLELASRRLRVAWRGAGPHSRSTGERIFTSRFVGTDGFALEFLNQLIRKNE